MKPELYDELGKYFAEKVVKCRMDLRNPRDRATAGRVALEVVVEYLLRETQLTVVHLSQVEDLYNS